jgi:hypothetical protein
MILEIIHEVLHCNRVFFMGHGMAWEEQMNSTYSRSPGPIASAKQKRGKPSVSRN